MLPLACALALAVLSAPTALSLSSTRLRTSARANKQVVRGRISCSLDIAGGAGVNSDPQADGKKVSDLLLKRIQGTDRGLSATPEQKKEIDGLIEQLNTIGEGKDWLSDPKTFGNFNVAYVSSGSSERSNPAGGRFRGRLGRAIFWTEDLFQHLIAPATVVNMVSFRALGVLRGCVTLRGEFKAMDDRPNFVRANFEPPFVNLLGKRGLTFRLGPKSSVALAATYVDERVRVGKGGRGSLFVFTTGGPADTPAAEMWKVYTNSRPIEARVLGAVLICGAMALALRRAFVPAFVPAGFLAVCSTLMISSRGGIEDG